MSRASFNVDFLGEWIISGKKVSVSQIKETGNQSASQILYIYTYNIGRDAKHRPDSQSEEFFLNSKAHGVSLVDQMVNNLPAMWETQVRSLAWEDPLEKEMATHSSILGRRIPRKEEPGGPQSMGSQIVGHDCETNTHTHKVHVISTKKHNPKVHQSVKW